MDSPAHPVEELGVTRLAQTCGHIFCRKELSTGAFRPVPACTGTLTLTDLIPTPTPELASAGGCIRA